MARRKREPMSERNKNIIGMLLDEYDIKSAKDIEDALKDLLGGTIQEMLESEMDEHLGYQEYDVLTILIIATARKQRRYEETSVKQKLKFRRIVTAHLSQRS